MGSGYIKEIFVNQEAAKLYSCEICKSVLKDPIQIHDETDAKRAKRACRECYYQKLEYRFVNLAQKVLTFK